MFKRAIIVVFFAASVAVADDDVRLRVATQLELLRIAQKPPPPKPKLEWNDADVPDGFVKYERATNTQSIYKNQFGPQIDAVSRTALKVKWQVPGGMEGLTGWKSSLYKATQSERWTGGIPVKNSFGNYQTESGWKRTYKDGDEFLDVLTNTDTNKVFEVRKAVKIDGSFQRFTIYRDKEQRPVDYAGPHTLDCRNCHNASDGPGSGDYGVAMTSGAETVFSDPFPDLENRVVAAPVTTFDAGSFDFQPQMRRGRRR